MEIFLDILMLLFLDIILSVDNAILIASTTKELDDKSRRWAQIIGASLAVLLRLVFVILVMLVLTQFAAVPTLYILGGLALVVIGILITKGSSDSHEGKAASSVMKAVALIMAGDIMLSFDNAFVIADISMGMELALGWTIVIIAIALLLSLVILLFFSNQLALMMKNNPWMIYIAAWLLVSVGIELMLKDSLFGIDEKYHLLCMFGAYALGGIITSLKWFIFDRNQKENTQN